MGNVFDSYRYIGWHVRLRVLSVVNLEAQVILALVRAGLHGYHARVLVELELCVLEALPVELLVRQVPVVQVVYVDPANLSLGRLTLLIMLT